MNLPPDHGITDAVMAVINNPLGEAGDPAIPFVYRQLAMTNAKIQVDKRDDNSKEIKQVVQIPYFGSSDMALHMPFFALKHAFNFYQHVKGIEFHDAKKQCKLFANLLLGMAALCWDSVVYHLIDVRTFQPTLGYFCKCLQA